MSENNVTMSNWEFDGICNTPERQAAADRKWQNEQKIRSMLAEKADRAEKEAILLGFYDKLQKRRRKRVEITAVRTGICAMAAGILGVYFFDMGLRWPGGIFLGLCALGACVAAYGAGMCREMDRQ